MLFETNVIKIDIKRDNKLVKRLIVLNSIEAEVLIDHFNALGYQTTVTQSTMNL